MMNTSLNYDELKDLLYTAIHRSFDWIQREHAHEVIYGFGLFHDPLWGSISPIYNTEQGLYRTALDYQRDKNELGFSKVGLETLLISLRWDSGDFIDDTSEDYFELVNEWLHTNDIVERCCDFFDYQWSTNEILDIALGLDAPRENFSDIISKVCIEAFQRARDEGLFNLKSQEQSVTLYFMTGDEDESWERYPKILNSPALYNRWASEVEEMRIADALIHRLLWE